MLVVEALRASTIAADKNPLAVRPAASNNRIQPSSALYDPFTNFVTYAVRKGKLHPISMELLHWSIEMKQS
jgi:hypothetical protein